jgi:hypothetical protein
MEPEIAARDTACGASGTGEQAVVVRFGFRPNTATTSANRPSERAAQAIA